uniref:Uncharacterized protein n=1 Tax=Arundo donax TaxID=35708 RepID=A0A0A8Z093_ARUDO
MLGQCFLVRELGCIAILSIGCYLLYFLTTLSCCFVWYLV